MLRRLRPTLVRPPASHGGAHSLGLRGPGHRGGGHRLLRTRGLRGGDPPGPPGVGRRRLRPDGLEAGPPAPPRGPSKTRTDTAGVLLAMPDVVDFRLTFGDRQPMVDAPRGSSVPRSFGLSNPEIGRAHV